MDCSRALACHKVVGQARIQREYHQVFYTSGVGLGPRSGLPEQIQLPPPNEGDPITHEHCWVIRFFTELLITECGDKETFDITAQFGGYKMCGYGRELGPMGLEEYLETKACMGMKV